MESFNFGAFDPTIGARLANIPQEAQKQQTANMLQAMQMQGAMREGQMSQMKIDEMVAERKEIDGLAAKLKLQGYTPKAYFTELVSSRNPARVQQGAEGLRRLELQDEFNTLFKGSLGAMFGGAEPAPSAAPPNIAGAAATRPVGGMPTTAVPTPPVGGAQANTLVAPSVNNLGRPGASVEDMERMVLGLGKYSKDVPGAETVSRLLEEKIKAARNITTVAPGITALRGGVPMYTAPTAFETMLANSELTTEAKVLARKALINKETNIAQPEFIDNLRALAETKDPVTRTFLINRLNYLTTHRPPSTQTVNLPGQEKAFEQELGRGQAKGILESRSRADDAVEIMTTVAEGRKILASGAITGFGADFIVQFSQALKQAGYDYGGDASANSQAYGANMAQNVGKVIKQFGAGTGLSDADREYAEKMAGGKITMDLTAIRRVLDINEKQARWVIATHNKRVAGIKSNIPLTVEAPTAGNVTTNPQYPGFSIGKP